MRTKFAVCVVAAAVIVLLQLRDLSKEHAEYLESTYGIGSPASPDLQTLAPPSPKG